MIKSRLRKIEGKLFPKPKPQIKVEILWDANHNRLTDEEIAEAKALAAADAMTYFVEVKHEDERDLL